MYFLLSMVLAQDLSLAEMGVSLIEEYGLSKIVRDQAFREPAIDCRLPDGTVVSFESISTSDNQKIEFCPVVRGAGGTGGVIFGKLAGSIVAVKVIFERSEVNESEIQREIAMMKPFSGHPGFVNLIGLVESSVFERKIWRVTDEKQELLPVRYPWMVMGAIFGPNIRERMDNEHGIEYPKITAEETSCYLMQGILILIFMEMKNIRHNDAYRGNFMIDRSEIYSHGSFSCNRIKLVDFGFAKPDPGHLLQDIRRFIERISREIPEISEIPSEFRVFLNKVADLVWLETDTRRGLPEFRPPFEQALDEALSLAKLRYEIDFSYSLAAIKIIGLISGLSLAIVMAVKSRWKRFFGEHKV
jgi:serine/threonine protein kinase